MILHIVEKTKWEIALKNGIYDHPSLKAEGFIHCSTKEQVIDIANLLYKGLSGLLLLCIDEDKVNSKIVYEDLYQLNKLYPHIYGPLNVDAIDTALDFEPETNGLFSLPTEIAN